MWVKRYNIRFVGWMVNLFLCCIMLGVLRLMYSELREFGFVYVVRWVVKDKDDCIEGYKIVFEEFWIWLIYGVVI